LLALAIAEALLSGRASAADLQKSSTPAPLAQASDAFNWTGVYVGGHLGNAWGKTNWTATPPASPSAVLDRGSLGLTVPLNIFNQGGSWFDGLQLGYNYMLPSRLVIGGEADVSFSAFPNYQGVNTGKTATVLQGAAFYTDAVNVAGSVRGRVGYSPGNWLFYATGGLAWTSEQFTLTQIASGSSESYSKQRLGWTVGAGVETPLIPHWTLSAEYLYSNFGTSGVDFPGSGVRFSSNLSEHKARIGLNYRVDDVNTSTQTSPTLFGVDQNRVAIHGQFTMTGLAYPTFKEPASFIPGPLTLPARGHGTEIGEMTLFAGLRPWEGGEIWITPEIDQGFGVNNGVGIADATTAEAYKLGRGTPYAKIMRAFVRQTIDLGGETQKVDADSTHFEGTQTADRLVLTSGIISPLDIFDTNTYSNSARTQFMNWGNVYCLTFDWGGDAWGIGPGLAAELYKDRFAFRLGWFDMSNSAYSNSTNAYGTDPTLSQYEIVGEMEERHELWGQPGKVKAIVNMVTGRLGTYADAIALGLATGQTPETSAVRQYRRKFDAHLNLEQQILPNVGVFSRVGLAPSYVEGFSSSDSHLSISGGISVGGVFWGRPKDTVGVAGIYNLASGVELNYLNLGGSGVLVSGGQAPFPTGPEKVLESYYSLNLTPSTTFTLDYQLVQNPGFNTSRGPANIFGGRIHWEF
jgi:high affinity Mn2+ porin